MLKSDFNISFVKVSKSCFASPLDINLIVTKVYSKFGFCTYSGGVMFLTIVTFLKALIWSNTSVILTLLSVSIWACTIKVFKISDNMFLI